MEKNPEGWRELATLGRTARGRVSTPFYYAKGTCSYGYCMHEDQPSSLFLIPLPKEARSTFCYPMSSSATYVHIPLGRATLLTPHQRFAAKQTYHFYDLWAKDPSTGSWGNRFGTTAAGVMHAITVDSHLTRVFKVMSVDKTEERPQKTEEPWKTDEL